MTIKKCYEIADAIFYNKEKVPDKMLYIERIMFSCVTKEQLAAAYKWGKGVISGINGTVAERGSKEYNPCDDLIIFDKFDRNCTSVLSQLKSTYNEILEKKMW